MSYAATIATTMGAAARWTLSRHWADGLPRPVAAVSGRQSRWSPWKDAIESRISGCFSLSGGPRLKCPLVPVRVARCSEASQAFELDGA
ncbi:hypothetical protein Nepgr_007004 [Nepenthes gracilis]|uniref:Uncharacterized protein n=1 Tax=Nepenthes gracilis TaxID=150966 RepID=A0AAD3S696_NEPGR|nr:hypothetical protein Nepgr_007004 [Nepenthes gracilis]